MAKEKLDSDKVNYMIWRYVLSLCGIFLDGAMGIGKANQPIEKNLTANHTLTSS